MVFNSALGSPILVAEIQNVFNCSQSFRLKVDWKHYGKSSEGCPWLKAHQAHFRVWDDLDLSVVFWSLAFLAEKDELLAEDNEELSKASTSAAFCNIGGASAWTQHFF